MARADLAGIAVWVTRPPGHNEVLAQRFAALGAEPVVFPLVDIRPPPDTAELERRLAGLETVDLALFTSRNAVHWGLAAVRRLHGAWPAAVPAAALGAGTAVALAAGGVAAAITAAPPYDSERLLDCPRLQAVRGQRIMIFRGIGGRRLLAAELRRRGARIEYAPCYQRAMPAGGVARLRARLAAWRCELIILTSVTALQNLRVIAATDAGVLLAGVTPLVFGPRLAAAWRRWGVGRAPRLAGEASDAALVEAALAWRRQHPARPD